MPRVVDDQVELSFWKPFLREKEMEGTDIYSRQVWNAVEGIIGGRFFDTVTEIGPGWGNYTFDLVEHCRKLTCVDMSKDVLEYISRQSRAMGANIRTVNSKWEDYSGKKTDLVFGFNCFYRMQQIESCLEKIDRLGDSHVIGMTSGPQERYLRDFEMELGLKIRYARMDYIVLVNILYQLGIDANVKTVGLRREYVFDSVETAAKKASKKILSKDYDIADLERIMGRYLKKDRNGSFHHVHDFKAALIYWRSARSFMTTSSRPAAFDPLPMPNARPPSPERRPRPCRRDL